MSADPSSVLKQPPTHTLDETPSRVSDSSLNELLDHTAETSQVNKLTSSVDHACCTRTTTKRSIVRLAAIVVMMRREPVTQATLSSFSCRQQRGDSFAVLRVQGNVVVAHMLTISPPAFSNLPMADFCAGFRTKITKTSGDFVQ